MYLIDLLLQLYNRFIQIDSVERSKIRNDAFSWFEKIDVSMEPTKETKITEKLKYHLKMKSETWYVKLFAGALFIYLVRAISDFMNPKIVENDEEF